MSTFAEAHAQYLHPAHLDEPYGCDTCDTRIDDANDAYCPSDNAMCPACCVASQHDGERPMCLECAERVDPAYAEELVEWSDGWILGTRTPLTAATSWRIPARKAS